MRVFICLSIFSFMLATCQEKCFSDPLSPPVKDGKGAKPNTCIDRYDGKTHPIRSRWSTAECYVCECSRGGMRCCQRASKTIIIVRCKKAENAESCKDGGIHLDDKCQAIIPLDIDDIDTKISLYISIIRCNIQVQ